MSLLVKLGAKVEEIIAVCGCCALQRGGRDVQCGSGLAMKEGRLAISENPKSIDQFRRSERIHEVEVEVERESQEI